MYALIVLNANGPGSIPDNGKRGFLAAAWQLGTGAETTVHTKWWLLGVAGGYRLPEHCQIRLYQDCSPQRIFRVRPSGSSNVYLEGLGGGIQLDSLAIDTVTTVRAVVSLADCGKETALKAGIVSLNEETKSDAYHSDAFMKSVARFYIALLQALYVLFSDSL